MGTNTDADFSHIKYSRFSPQGTTTLFLGTSAGQLYKVENAQDIPQATEIGSNETVLRDIVDNYIVAEEPFDTGAVKNAHF